MKDLEKNKQEQAYSYDHMMEIQNKDMIKETQTAYLSKQPGEFNLDDYYALPDDVRAELIDGVLYEMTAPTFSHQKAISKIARMLETHIEQKKGNCEVIALPYDVQLDRDDRTMVEPDIMIVCDQKKITNRSLYGAPDFVVEVLSPSTAKKDMTLKLFKYCNAGVREYWIVDLKKKRVLVYEWEGDSENLSIYGFDSKIPVGIFNGDCIIDFSEIWKEISRFNE